MLQISVDGDVLKSRPTIVLKNYTVYVLVMAAPPSFDFGRNAM